MTIKRLLLIGTVIAAPMPAFAQAWTVSAPTISWVDTPTRGFGLDTVAEVFTATQGGDPPFTANESANNDQNNYTRTAWLNANASSTGATSDKFRLTCEFSGFGMFDSILAYGGTSSHHHTFFGSPPSATATFSSLRAATAKSTCSGGPLNRSLYWEASWLSELPKNGTVSGGVTLVKAGVTRANQTGGVVIAPRKPNVVTFYYQGQLSDAAKRVRFFNGFGMIFGVDPSDRMNLVRLGEIPDGAGWAKETNPSGTKRYNGWLGWSCFDKNSGLAVTPNPASDADINPDNGNPRQWLNSDGSDPWYEGGVHKCDSTLAAPKILIPELLAPTCWDGINGTSPTGRGHVRYAILKQADQDPNHAVCFNNAFILPELQVKVEYPATTHAERQRSYLASDRMDADPNNWQPNGSTMHADLITAWDSVIRDRWMRRCMNLSINGTAGKDDECNANSIDVDTPAALFEGENAPDTALANSPVVTIRDYGPAAASKNKFGSIISGGTVTATMRHPM